MNGPRNLAQMKAGLAFALLGSVIGCLVPAYCEGQRSTDRGTLSQATTPTWVATGNLNTARYGHTATLLPNGKVLVVGGANDGNILDGAELYDPATGTLSVTGRLNAAHAGHTATLLPNGQVLIVGGVNIVSSLDNAELYDPGAGTWSRTSSPTTYIESGCPLPADAGADDICFTCWAAATGYNDDDDDGPAERADGREQA